MKIIHQDPQKQVTKQRRLKVKKNVVENYNLKKRTEQKP